MQVLSIVNRVRQLEGKDGSRPIYSVSLEGFGVLASADRPIPEEGQFIRAVVEVIWRKGKRPVHWLRSWSEA